MTQIELDEAIAREATIRACSPPYEKSALIAARLAREGWRPKQRFEDAARDIVKFNAFSTEIERVRLGIEYGASLPPKPAKQGVPMHLDSVMTAGIKGSAIKLRYCSESEAVIAWNIIDRMPGLGGPR